MRPVLSDTKMFLFRLFRNHCVSTPAVSGTWQHKASTELSDDELQRFLSTRIAVDVEMTAAS